MCTDCMGRLVRRRKLWVPRSILRSAQACISSAMDLQNLQRATMCGLLFRNNVHEELWGVSAMCVCCLNLSLPFDHIQRRVMVCRTACFIHFIFVWATSEFLCLALHLWADKEATAGHATRLTLCIPILCSSLPHSVDLGLAIWHLKSVACVYCP